MYLALKKYLVGWLLCIGLFFLTANILTAKPETRLIPSGSVYGGAGYWHMRNARFMPDGQIDVGTSQSFPNDRYFINFSALPWLETTFRYTIIPERFDGSSLNDRSFDIKLKLIDENKYIPQIAIGLQDIGGTGVFSGEYIVASKRYYNWDASIGIGWGRLGTDNIFKNPLTYFSKGFEKRDTNFGLGGKPNLNTFFRGEDVGFFAGVEYHTPIKGLRLKAEWNSDAHIQEQRIRNNKFIYKTPLNIGISYKPSDDIDAGICFEHGSQIMFRLSLNLTPNAPVFPRKINPSPAPALKQRDDIIASTQYVSPQPKMDVTNNPFNLFEYFKQQNFYLYAYEFPSSHDIVLYIADTPYRTLPEAIASITKHVINHLDPEIERITYSFVEHNMELSRISVMRRDFERMINYQGSPEEVWAHTELQNNQKISETAYFNPDNQFKFSWNMKPQLRQSLMDPDQPYRFQIYWSMGAEIELAPGLSLNGTIGKHLIGNLDEIDRGAGSALPHVRSDIAKYFKQGKDNLINLQTDYYHQLAPNVYGLASAGIFEEMFGGIGGEILYHNPHQPWAVGLNLYHVWQRDFDQRFTFQKYNVTTGHLSLYYDLPFYNLNTTIHLGRYLAKDYGGTFILSRRFDSGFEMGGFFTLTDVPFATFGEGSFDKGFFIKIPLEHLTPYPTKSSAGFLIRLLTRDGGQMLIRNELMDRFRNHKKQHYQNHWHKVNSY